MLEALRRWQAEEGRPPRAYEWAPWAAAALGIRSARTLKWEREHDRWPSLGIAVARWGSWRQALQSAGLATHPPLVLPLPLATSRMLRRFDRAAARFIPARAWLYLVYQAVKA